MTRLQLYIGFGFLVALTVAAGALHGRLSGRWGTSVAALEAAEHLGSVPEQFGSWRLVRREPLGETELDQLQPYGYMNNIYVHLGTEQQISVFVLAGPVGRTAVHNPEICFSSRSFGVVSGPEQSAVRASGRGVEQFWAMTFRSKDLAGGLVRVYYAWSEGTRWEATEGGRYKFAGYPYLYKIQVSAMLPPNADVGKDDPCRAFLEDFLPALHTHIVPASRAGLASSKLPPRPQHVLRAQVSNSTVLAATHVGGEGRGEEVDAACEPPLRNHLSSPSVRANGLSRQNLLRVYGGRTSDVALNALIYVRSVTLEDELNLQLALHAFHPS